MKGIISALIGTLCLCSGQAQPNEGHALYFNGEFLVGNYFGLEGGLNFVYRGRTSFKLAYSGLLREPRSQPGDFSSGLAGILSLGLADPFDELSQFQVAVGRVYPLNARRTIRLNFNVGVGIVTIREPANWQRVQASFFGTNYQWDYEQYRTLSLNINPKFEFPLTRIAGLSLSPTFQIKKDRVYVGIGIGTILGVLRSRQEPASGTNSP